jgi:hypothetical protein
MMSTTDLDARLTHLGHHLDDERAVRAATVTSPAPDRPAVMVTNLDDRRSGAADGLSGRTLGRVAAVVLLGVAVAAGALAVAQRPASDAVGPADRGQPAPVPDGAPLPGSVLPYVESPPKWFGQPRSGEREGAIHTGHWVSTAIGIDGGNGTTQDPIWVAATDGSLKDLDTAETIVTDGQRLRLLDLGTGWQTVATTSQPMIVVSGTVETSLLLEVVQAVRAEASGGGISLHVDALPDSYTELVPAQAHAEDVAHRQTLAGATAENVINEISDWVQPELAAAATGADYEEVIVGDSTGWTGRSESHPFGPLRFLVWSPEPGVVLEIVTTDLDRSVDDLVQLAGSVRLLPADEWDEVLAYDD